MCVCACVLIKGTSPSGPSRALLRRHWAEEAETAGAPFFERVPSPSNIADEPSRLLWEDFRKHFPNCRRRRASLTTFLINDLLNWGGG